jgi:hypothetical protein
MKTQIGLIILAVAIAYSASCFRYDIIRVPDSSISYKLDRLTGNVQLTLASGEGVLVWVDMKSHDGDRP